MSDESRRPSSTDAMEKIITNMTENQNSDGQYMPLGFSSQQNLSEPLNWGPQTSNAYMNYHLHYQEPHLNQACREQMPNYIQGNSLYEPVLFPKNMPEYNGYTMRSNSAPQTFYNIPQNVIPDNILHDSINHNPPIFDNLSWANNAGTYSPFGNTDPFKPSLFDFQGHIGKGDMPEEEVKFKQNDLIDDKFNFNKDRKAKPLAEVKPMRPSYSDILTKPVPATNTKIVKPESKDVKVKKDSRKNGKIDKTNKSNNLLNRSNTNNEINLQTDKPLLKSDKKPVKANQLNRKWASLDNIVEPTKTDEQKRIKKPEETINKINKPKPKLVKNLSHLSDEIYDDSVKSESFSITKNSAKKNKSNNRQKHTDGHNEKNPGKRNQRARKKDDQPIYEIIAEKVRIFILEWWKVITVFMLWLFNLISDVFSLSIHLGKEFTINFWSQLKATWTSFTSSVKTILKRWRLSAWLWEKFDNKFRRKSSKPKEEETNSYLDNGLKYNISLPTTGDEAMKRLLACKGKDPYSILGVTPKCSDDDIKKYYKRQAVLVHPDKNHQPGTEEAFKILVHAFDMIGTAERRATYDRGVAESAFVVQNFSQMAELLRKLHQKVELNATTIRCSACNDRHKRIKIDRPSYAARNCKSCKIHHAAREGDIWAESGCLGFLWHYYACMEGSVYDITDWAGCQKDTLKHLKPDSHHVQYRIALGRQNNSQPRRNSQTPRNDKPDLENLLNSLYGHNDGATSRRKNKKK